MSEVKQYLLFGGNEIFEPSGGWWDFLGSYNTIEEANAAFNFGGKGDPWAHVIDRETLEIVAAAKVLDRNRKERPEAHWPES